MIRILVALALLLTSIPLSPASSIEVAPHAVTAPTPSAWEDFTGIYRYDAGGTHAYAATLSFSEPPSQASSEQLRGLGITIVYPYHYLPDLGVIGTRENLEKALNLPGVVGLELAPRFVPVLDVSARAIQARSSNVYPSAESLGLCGRGVTIGILDTGVDDSHESLAGKFVAGADVSNTMPLALVPPFNEINPSDDNLALGSVTVDVPPSSASVSVGLSHGTHVAGIAMGTGGPTHTYQGVAPCANLVDVKVLSGAGYGASPSANEALPNPFGVAAGLEWVLDYNAGKTHYGNPGANRVRVINLSLSNICGTNPAATTLENLVDTVSSHGIVVVAAAGNCSAGGGVMFPGTSPEAITVGAMDDRGTIDRSDDVLAFFSSTRDPLQESQGLLKPDVVAPGVAITSARGAAYSAVKNTIAQAPPPAGAVVNPLLDFLLQPLGSYEKALPNTVGTSLPFSVIAEDEYHPLSGTSMAAPHVTGIAALLLEKDPNLSPRQVKEAIVGTAAGDGLWHSGVGFGYANAYAAAQAVPSGEGLAPDVAIVKPADGLRAWGGALSLLGASVCDGQLVVFASPVSGSLTSVTLQIDSGPVMQIANNLIGGYYTYPRWDTGSHAVHLIATNSFGKTQREDKSFAACASLPGNAPGVATSSSDRFYAHLAAGASAGVISPDGRALLIVYNPPPDYVATQSSSAVVTVNFDGTFSARNWKTPSQTVPLSYFAIVGGSVVGVPADGTWIIKAGYNLGGGAAGIQVDIQGKTFDHVANGETCFGVLTSSNSEPIEQGGTGYFAGDQLSFVKLWNWHKQSKQRYDSSCAPSNPLLGVTNSEESPQSVQFFPPASVPGGP